MRGHSHTSAWAIKNNKIGKQLQEPSPSCSLAMAFHCLICSQSDKTEKEFYNFTREFCLLLSHMSNRVFAHAMQVRIWIQNPRDCIRSEMACKYG